MESIFPERSYITTLDIIINITLDIIIITTLDIIIKAKPKLTIHKKELSDALSPHFHCQLGQLHFIHQIKIIL